MLLKIIGIFILLNISLLALSSKEKIIKKSLYPYSVKGITYYPHTVSIGESKDVLASWYGEYFHGRKTAMGETYDMNGYTAAHKTYPLGTVILVTNPRNGKSLKVRINDRGPFWNNRELDLSMGAAEYLGTKRAGVAKVHYRVVSVPDIVNSIRPLKETFTPLQPIYNIGYNAISYTTITQDMRTVPIHIGDFLNKEEANRYLNKLKKYFPNANIINKKSKYKVELFFKVNEEFIIKELKKLKKIGLITGYGLCWSYN